MLTVLAIQLMINDMSCLPSVAFDSAKIKSWTFGLGKNDKNREHLDKSYLRKYNLMYIYMSAIDKWQITEIKDSRWFIAVAIIPH